MARPSVVVWPHLRTPIVNGWLAEAWPRTCVAADHPLLRPPSGSARRLPCCKTSRCPAASSRSPLRHDMTALHVCSQKTSLVKSLASK